MRTPPPRLVVSAIVLLALSACAASEQDPPDTIPAAVDAGVPVEVVDAGCVPGGEGCACAVAGCERGLRCVDDVCVADTCAAGDVGCVCRADLTCNAADDGSLTSCNRSSLLCEVVVDDSDTPGAPNFDCFTPCSADLELPDGTFRFCDSDGLISGCIGDLSCVEGSCVAEGETPRTCSVPSDCPSFQACVSGRCLANCSFDSECTSDAVCHERACRASCSSVDDSCGSGTVCTTENGVDGVCLPQATTVAVAAGSTAPRLSLSTESLSFTNNKTSGTVSVTNTSTRPVRFTVSRVEHAEITDAGRTLVTESPLFWPRLSATIGGVTVVQPTRSASIGFDLEGGASANVILTDVDNDDLLIWEGRIAIEGEGLGTRSVWLDYATLPEGQWTGTLHSFIHFDDDNLDAWLTAMRGTSRSQKVAAARQTKNALLVQWTEFRTNPLFVVNEWEAVLQSATTGSHAFSSVDAACRGQFSGTSNAACYLYADGDDDDAGLRLFTDSTSLRIPQGVLEMPVTVRLQKASADGRNYTGRIETSSTLQYGGNPAVSLTFGDDPASCEASGNACLAPVSTFAAEILVGGRSLAADNPTGACDAAGSVEVAVPWLLPDFVAGTELDDAGARFRRECRESRFPNSTSTSSNLAVNASLAGANPVPDGRVRRRSLELLDGVLVNQDTLQLLVRERFDANFTAPAGSADDVADFQNYGVLVLRRSAADLTNEPAPFTPGLGADDISLDDPDSLIATACSDTLIANTVGTLNGNEASLAKLLLFGVDTTTPPAAVGASRVHYLCHATGNFDGGSDALGAGGEACPAGSGVTFFLADGLGDDDIKNNACQSDARCTCVADDDEDCVDVVCEAPGSCADELLALAANPANDVITDIPFQCDTPHPTIANRYTGVPSTTRVQCTDDRFDLRTGKLFYDPGLTPTTSPSLRNLIDAAFRYKTRFQNRNETGSVGFTPSICELNSDVIPYCYDPAAIDEVRERVTCLAALFGSGSLDDTDDTHDAVAAFLRGALSFHVDSDKTRDGFERLYAELLILLGDEALTDAVGSRFDLAGAAVAGFDGDLLEPGGIRLSGGAGYEMRLLYQAHQYYQLALDRFARLSPLLWQGLSDEDKNFITLDSISTYFNRLIQASTKKARAASQIARRYQSFDRADLARHVVERAYTEAYLESITIAQLMRSSIAVLDANEIDALQSELRTAQRQYRAALEQMREAYQGISDELTSFGIAPDFIPFPAPARFTQSAPRIMFERALESLALAKERENRALESNRAFDTDAAQFQAELARVRQQFESQLADLCGEFDGADGARYPAIKKYASESAVTAVLGDPCGLLGAGSIFEATSDVEALTLALRAEIADLRAVIERVAIEQARVADECASRVDIADIAFKAADARITLREEIQNAQQEIARWERAIGVLDRSATVLTTTAQAFGAVASGFGACDGLNPAPCIGSMTAATAASGLNAAAAVIQTGALATQIAANKVITDLEEDIRDDEIAIEAVSRDAEYQTQIAQCCLDAEYIANPSLSVTTCEHPGPLLINSTAVVDTLLLDLKRGSIEAARAEVDLRRAVGRLAGLRSQATRLAAQQEETEDNIINVEAARNDPNIRIFANADVLNADVAFERALQDAFRATRMYEYYTASTYAAKENLFLVRLAGRGENNLEDYVVTLQRDFNDFEQTYGVPQGRVLLLSLMDDIFHVPEIDDAGAALSPTERQEKLRALLTDPDLLDDDGVIRIPFSTSLSQTSPITVNHKLTFIEAEIQGTDVGDRLGRINLKAKGTSVIRDFDGGEVYHRIDSATAVVNTFFNGVRLFSDDIYQNDRLRDRPLINSLWELGLDLRNEDVNLDINPNSITDIRVFLFYEDFAR